MKVHGLLGGPFEKTEISGTCVACGPSSSYIIKEDGTLYGCGLNNFGQMGMGHQDNPHQFMKSNIDNVKFVDSGFYQHTVLIKHDRTIWGAGNNETGALLTNTNSTTMNNTLFIQSPIATNVKQIACGYGKTFAVMTDGRVYVSGFNETGEIGLNVADRTYHRLFNEVTSLGNNVRQVACGYYFTIALKEDGTLWGAGSNTYRTIGTLTSEVYRSFVQLPDIDNVKQIACGYQLIVALKNDGTVWVRGNCQTGQAGLGTASANNGTFSYFVQIPNMNEVSEIVCSGYGTVFMLKHNGELWTTGSNSYGMAGLGNTSAAYVPTKVPVDNVKQVACGEYHTLLMTKDGNVYSAGYNNNYQLGIGNTSNKSTFTAVNYHIL